MKRRGRRDEGRGRRGEGLDLRPGCVLILYAVHVSPVFCPGKAVNVCSRVVRVCRLPREHDAIDDFDIL